MRPTPRFHPILPPWVKWNKEKEQYQATIEPFVCQKCGTKWYPRISPGGKIEIPTGCAKVGCRNKIWWKARNKPSK